MHIFKLIVKLVSKLVNSPLEDKVLAHVRAVRMAGYVCIYSLLIMQITFCIYKTRRRKKEKSINIK